MTNLKVSWFAPSRYIDMPLAGPDDMAVVARRKPWRRQQLPGLDSSVFRVFQPRNNRSVGTETRANCTVQYSSRNCCCC